MENKIPITVGIIGHRDAVITLEHKKLIANLFDDLSKYYPNSPFCLFSQLAEGADTEIANLFIEKKQKEKREFDLIVPLPFELTEYRSGFSEKGKKEFDELISKASRHFVIKKIKTNSRDELYETSGQFVADSSIILIALWEEKDNKKTGGTASIVKYKREGSSQEDKIFDQKGHLISLPCNRLSAGNSTPIALSDEPLFSIIMQDDSIKKSIEKIEELNTAFPKVDTAALSESQNKLFSKDSNISQSNIILKKYYSAIDVLAIQNQKKYNGIIKILFLIGFAFIVLFEIYKHGSATQIALIPAIFLIVTAFVIYRISKRNKNHKKFLEFRILAEVLRIQFFWNVANLNKLVTNHILRIHKSEFIWIKHIILAINGLTYHTQENNVSSKTIKECWLESEKNYFKNKVAATGKTRNIFKTISTIFFSIAIFCMVFLFALDVDKLLNNEKINSFITTIAFISFVLFLIAYTCFKIEVLSKTINKYFPEKNAYTLAVNKTDEIEKASIDKIKKTAKAISTIFLSITFICIIFLFALKEIFFSDKKEMSGDVNIIIGISLGIFALANAYVEIKGIQQTINQYSLMKDIYTSAVNKVNEFEKSSSETTCDKDKLENIYILAGKEAMVEIGNWYLIFKEKEPRIEGI